jgi:hypothetical protein
MASPQRRRTSDRIPQLLTRSSTGSSRPWRCEFTTPRPLTKCLRGRAARPADRRRGLRHRRRASRHPVVPRRLCRLEGPVRRGEGRPGQRPRSADNRHPPSRPATSSIMTRPRLPVGECWRAAQVGCTSRHPRSAYPLRRPQRAHWQQAPCCTPAADAGDAIERRKRRQRVRRQ